MTLLNWGWGGGECSLSAISHRSNVACTKFKLRSRLQVLACEVSAATRVATCETPLYH